MRGQGFRKPRCAHDPEHLVVRHAKDQWICTECLKPQYTKQPAVDSAWPEEPPTYLQLFPNRASRR